MNIVITGAGSGIGKATLISFCNEGRHNIVAIGRNEKNLEEIKIEGEKISPRSKITPIVFDLKSNQKDFESLSHRLNEHLTSVDILINNAGLFINKPFTNLSESDWQDLFESNIFAPAKLIKTLLPMMGQRGNSHIVNIGSMGGFQGSQKFSGLSAYCSSKSALASLTETLAQELPRSIHINCLCFGSVNTTMFDSAFPNSSASMPVHDAGELIANFSLKNFALFNGKIIPVAITNP